MNLTVQKTAVNLLAAKNAKTPQIKVCGARVLYQLLRERLRRYFRYIAWITRVSSISKMPTISAIVCAVMMWSSAVSQSPVTVR